MRQGKNGREEQEQGGLVPARVSRRPGSEPAGMDEIGAEGSVSVADELEKYLVHLAHLDMALPLKIELIRALRGIMQNFVDRAFGDDPVQQVFPPEGNSTRKHDRDAGPVLDLETSTNNQTEDLSAAFRDPADGASRRK